MIKEDINYDEILKDYAYKNVLREDANSITYILLYPISRYIIRNNQAVFSHKNTKTSQL